MNKVFLLVLFFLFPATQMCVGLAPLGPFASPCPEVDLVSGAGVEYQLAMAASPVLPDTTVKSQSQAKAEKVEASPLRITLLVFIMILMIVVGVLRFRVMAIENDQL